MIPGHLYELFTLVIIELHGRKWNDYFGGMFTKNFFGLWLILRTSVQHNAHCSACRK